jgi:NADPH-dependent glutamate synthase beta subunit-like oxidoreductase/NAD-dependent dihydropyrimidine dehydrogenase PreA subunit
MSIAQIDSALCNGCGACVDSCPEDVIRLDSMPKNKEEIPACTAACPAGVNIRRYMHMLKLGMIDEAAAILRESLSIPAVTGRVCPHPCESECARREVDQAVNINGIERFLGDYWLYEKAQPIRKIYAGKIAVIGSGPAGLACAYFLCRMGYPVTVFEALSVLGGMLRIGIPEYRLPRNVLDAQINYIRDMGVEFRKGVSIGHDIDLKELTSQYDAVFIAVGAQQGKQLALEGKDLDGFVSGLDFLRSINLHQDTTVEKRLVVVGGGNVAVDVALTALRMGAKEVHMACLESMDEMPAYEDEIQQALDEGVEIHPSWGPRRILGKNGKVAGIELVRCTQVLDNKHAFSPSFDDQVIASLEADQVILAIGQEPDLSLFPEKVLTVNSVTMETGTLGVFAGGDAVSSGISSVVQAIADGKRAALSIDRYLKGQDLTSKNGEQPPLVKKSPRDGITPFNRQTSPLLPVNERAGNFREVKCGFDEDTVNREVCRCMTCGSEAVITYPDDCMICLYCERDCPMQAIYVSPEKTIGPILPWG